MRLRAFRIVLMGCLCLAATSVTEAQERQKTTFDYSVGKDGLIPLVRVTLKGQTNTFAFDTGTNLNFINDSLATALKLPIGPLVNPDGSPLSIDGEPVQGAQTSVLVGSYLQQDTLLILKKASHLQSINKQIDGLLGMHFMRQCALLFDFQKRQITLWSPGDLSEKDLKEFGMDDAIVLGQAKPDAPGSNWNFLVTTRLNKQTNVDLVIDTGSWDTMIPTQAAHQLKLVPTRRNIPYRSLDGPSKSEEATLTSLALGPILIHGAEVYYTTQQHDPPMGHIGLDILSHFRMLIDFPARKLYLKPDQGIGSVPQTSKNASRHKQDH